MGCFRKPTLPDYRFFHFNFSEDDYYKNGEQMRRIFVLKVNTDMEKKMKKTIFLLTLFAVMLSACAGGTSVNLAGEWALVSYGDAAAPTPALPGVDTSITFDEGQFGGTVGCNSFGGDYKINGDQMSIGSVFSTMMFCDQTSTQESAVLAILSDQTMTVTQSGNQLILSSADGKSVVMLEKK